MTITHYGQPGNLQFQYPIQTPLRLETFPQLAIQFTCYFVEVHPSRDKHSFPAYETIKLDWQTDFKQNLGVLVFHLISAKIIIEANGAYDWTKPKVAR